MKILKILNIERDEARPILMLIAYSFFMGLSIAFYFTATISDFLVDFDISYMPYTYILSGVLGYILWLIWSKLEKSLNFTGRLLTGIGFLFITVAALGIASLYMNNKWISFVMLVWVRVFIFVNMVNFWGIAGKLFNISQGKRLFGIISIGSVISDLIGFFSIPFILLLGVQNSGLLIIALIALVICLLITFQITKIFKDSLREEAKVVSLNDLKQKKEPFFKSKYHFFLFSLAILPMFGFYFVDYLFLDQIQIAFQSGEAIASFMGIFFGIVALFELFIKTTVFSRLIYNFGLRITLLTLPVILLGSVVLTITMGLFAGGFGFLFSMIAFIKLLEKVLRSGINDPSFQILYQPIPSQERLTFQSKMEGIPTALGNILAGALLLLMIFFNLNSPLLFNAIFLIVLVFWCYMAFKMYSEYKEVIINNLAGLKDEKKSDALSEEMNPGYSSEEKNSESALEGFRSLLLSQYVDMKSTIQKLSDLLEQSSVAIEDQMNSFIKKYSFSEYPVIAQTQIGGQLFKRPDLAISMQTAELYSANDNYKMSLIELLRSPLPEQRHAGLKMLYNTNRNDINNHTLEYLLLDTNPAVVNGALDLFKRPLNHTDATFLTELMDKMPLSHLLIPLFDQKNGELESLILKKLQQNELEQGDNLNSLLQSFQLIKILSNIGGHQSIEHLVKLLESNHEEIQFFASKALNILGFKANENDKYYFMQLIEKEVSFCAWLLACKQDLSINQIRYRKIIHCLNLELSSSEKRIFVYLSYFYPKETIKALSANLKSTSTEKTVLGIEMCEMLFSPTLRALVLPVFIKSSDSEKLSLLTKDFPQQSLSPTDRLANISYYNFVKVNEWIKMYAMDLLSKKVKKTPKEIIANTFSNNPYIKESAYLAIHNIDPYEFEIRLKKEPKPFRLEIKAFVGHAENQNKPDSLFELIEKLKSFFLFEDIEEIILLKIASRIIKLNLSATTVLSNAYGSAPYIHFVYRGGLKLYSKQYNSHVLFSENMIAGLFEPFNLRDISFEVEENTELLVVDASLFFKLVSIYDDLKTELDGHCNILFPLDDYYFYS